MNGGPNGKCRQIVAPVQKFCHTPRDHGQRLDETLDETAPEGKVVLISRSEPTVSSIRKEHLLRKPHWAGGHLAKDTNAFLDH